MSCEIPVLCGNEWRVVLCDSEDFEKLSAMAWTYRSKTGVTACYLTGGRHRDYAIARFLLDLPVISEEKQKRFVVFKNGDQFDCRRTNLLVTTQALKGRKQEHKRGCSGFIGVRPMKSVCSPWYAYVYVKKKNIYIGCFTNAIDAAKARDDFVRKLPGANLARYNFPDGVAAFAREDAKKPARSRMVGRNVRP